MGEEGIACELIADGHHVSGTLMKLLYRAKGRDGICLVTDAIAGAGFSDGAHFSLYGRDCVVTAGVGLQADQLALAGSVSRMIDLVRTMFETVHVPLHEAISMATLTPARVIGLEAKGRLQVGADADLVVLSPGLQVLETFVAGESIFADTKRAVRESSSRKSLPTQRAAVSTAVVQCYSVLGRASVLTAAAIRSITETQRSPAMRGAGLCD